MKPFQALLASSSSAFAAALPIGFLGAALAIPCETAFSTATSVKPFFTAFLTAFSTRLAAFFFALSLAIFPHNHHRVRAALFAVFSTDFFAAFLAGAFLPTTFLAIFFAGLFLAVFLATAFFAAFLANAFLTALFAATFLAGAFWAVFLTMAFVSGDFVRTPVIVVTAAPTAVLTEPATSSAIAIPYPTASAAFSTIVFSAILRSLSLYVHSQLRIVHVGLLRSFPPLSPLLEMELQLKR